MHIRAAEDRDAEAATEAIRRSITELCRADHGGDEDVLARWLANKRPDIFRLWLKTPDNHLIVAESEDGRIMGVAGANDDGWIQLNYVDPDFRFSGVSKALIAALEAHLLREGHHVCHLTSTATARAFYRDRGYRDDGPPRPASGRVEGQPMVKELGAG